MRAAAPHTAPARTPGVYAQRLYARTHTSGRTKSVQDAPTTNDHGCTDAEPTKHTQHFTGKGVWGFGKDADIERPKALHDANPQSVLKGIGNLSFLYNEQTFLYKLYKPN